MAPGAGGMRSRFSGTRRPIAGQLCAVQRIRGYYDHRKKRLTTHVCSWSAVMRLGAATFGR
jgi:hypothetical protein